MGRQRDMVGRWFQLVQAIGNRRYGLSIAQLVDLTGSSRATVYRDIVTLEQYGVPFGRERINGEVRHTLGTQGSTAVISIDELTALGAARELLTGLEGSKLVEELDKLLRRVCNTWPAQHLRSSISISPSQPASSPALTRGIDLAIRHGHRLAFDYRGNNDQAKRRRLVDPIALRLHQDQLYLISFDVERNDWRQFKVARISGDLSIEGDADPHPQYNEADLFKHAVGVWMGEPMTVAIRLAANVADRVCEWPLSQTQTTEPQTDGSVIVRAQVAGLVETSRWVLSWGGAAEAMEPLDLRRMVAGDLRKAVGLYEDV